MQLFSRCHFRNRPRAGFIIGTSETNRLIETCYRRGTSSGLMSLPSARVRGHYPRPSRDASQAVSVHHSRADKPTQADSESCHSLGAAFPARTSHRDSVTLRQSAPLIPHSDRARLEAVFDPARPVDERARRMLAAGPHVAGLLLEIERANGRWPLGCARSRSDGAAPLVGSSRAIRLVRDRIERVAATDFTVLIREGSSTAAPWSY